jgi:hypothetical protein
VPKFFRVNRRPVLDDIHNALFGAFDPIRKGRDWLRYASIACFRISGTRRSSGRFIFVLEAGNTIHQLPFTSLNVLPISNVAKFFSLHGMYTRSAIIKPFRIPLARSISFFE